MKPVKKIKGIVMQVEQKTMVIVTDEGDFLRVPLPAQRPFPGEKVDAAVNKGFTRPFWVGAAAVILIFVLSLGLVKPMLMPQAVAAVSMDLISSVELTVDQENKVVTAKANNPEGLMVLQELDLKGKDIYEAANLVTTTASELGYIREKSENTIMVTVSPLNEEAKVSVDRDILQQSMHDELDSRNFQGYLVVNRMGREIMQKAAEMGLTVNQYLYLERSRASGDEIDVTVFKEQSLQELIVADDTTIEGMFPGRWCRVGGSNMGRGGMGSMNNMGMGMQTAPRFQGYEEKQGDINSEPAPVPSQEMHFKPNMGSGGFMGQSETRNSWRGMSGSNWQ